MILRFKSVPSTNDIAKELIHKYLGGASADPAGYAIVAEQQTRGRGRLGKHWHSPKGGLWASFIEKKPALEDYSYIIGERIIQALRKQFPEAMLQLKYPNDILANGKKLSGILVEPVWGRENYVIAGIGINVANDVPENAISLKELGYDANCEEILHMLIGIFISSQQT